MNTPFVSVIIPIFNTQRYLRECIDSIINQTLKNIEIICVNDGSTDSSPAILDQYALEDNRIHVIHKTNSGYGHTMNTGIAAARGEYIAFVESDDYIEPDMLETLCEIATREEVDMVKADFAHVYGEGVDRYKQVIKIWWDKDEYNRVLNPYIFTDIFSGCIANWAGIYRKSFIDKFGIKHNETPGASYQDVGFWFQVLTQADKIYLTDHVFYMYRQDNPNASVKNKGKVYCICEEYQFIYEFLNKHPELYRRYINIYNYVRYANYMFTYNRIANEYKLEFLHRFQKDFLEAEEKKELDIDIFNNQEKQIIQLIMRDPNGFYRLKQDFPKHISNLVKDFSNVIIFGAGMKGKEVMHGLMQSDAVDKLICFAVTENKANPPYVDGIPVREIEKLMAYKQDTAILVAVSDIYKDEVVQTLMDNEFEHPILI